MNLTPELVPERPDSQGRQILFRRSASQLGNFIIMHKVMRVLHDFCK